MAMRPLNQPFPKSGVAPSSAPTKATTSQPTPAPPAPPLPTDKDKAKLPLSSPTSASTVKKAANAAASVKAPISNLAEEAAKKAKQVQLDRLREKVHGKKDVAPSAKASNKDKENEKPAVTSPSPASTTLKKTVSTTNSVSDSVEKLSIGSEASAAAATGLQSPTTGKWRSTAPPGGSSQSALQSPTTGAWKSGSLDGEVTKHHGSVVASAIPEASSSEEEDSEEESSDGEEDEEEEDDDDDENEDEEEDEDEDDNDSNDDSDEEESEDEGEKGKVKK